MLNYRHFYRQLWRYILQDKGYNVKLQEVRAAIEAEVNALRLERGKDVALE